MDQKYACKQVPIIITYILKDRSVKVDDTTVKEYIRNCYFQTYLTKLNLFQVTIFVRIPYFLLAEYVAFSGFHWWWK
jgi:hypothetical protein